MDPWPGLAVSVWPGHGSSLVFPEEPGRLQEGIYNIYAHISTAFTQHDAPVFAGERAGTAMVCTQMRGVSLIL